MSALSQILLAGYGVAAPSAPAPVVETTSVGINAGTTTHVVTLPSGITAGDLLVVFFGIDGNPTMTVPGDWTELITERNPVGGVEKGFVYYKTAAGSDSLTMTSSATENSAYNCYRISGADSIEASAKTDASTATTVTFQPLTPSTGFRAYLALIGILTQADPTVSASPAGFTNLLTANQNASGTGSVRMSTLRSNISASSISPGNATLSGTLQKTTFTVAISSS